MTRIITASIELNAEASIGVSYLHKREGENIGFGESEHAGRERAGNLEADGSVSVRLKSSPPRGEENVDEVCRILLETLNREGGAWTNLRQVGDRDVDCRAERARDPTEVLQIQVVQARIDETFGTTSTAQEKLSQRFQSRLLLACFEMPSTRRNERSRSVVAVRSCLLLMRRNFLR